MYTYRKHRATGNPVGRPRTLPENLDEMILESIKKRIDPRTKLAKYSWSEMALDFRVSRSTIARQMRKLHRRGRIVSVPLPHPTLPDKYETFIAVPN